MSEPLMGFIILTGMVLFILFAVYLMWPYSNPDI